MGSRMYLSFVAYVDFADAMQAIFLSFLEQIQEFLEEKEKPSYQPHDADWFVNVGRLADVL